MRQAFAAEVDDLLLGGQGALLQRNEGAGCLAPFFVGSRSYAGLQHRRMAIKYRLNLNGGNAFPPEMMMSLERSFNSI